MLNSFQHLIFKTRFRNKFGMTQIVIMKFVIDYIKKNKLLLFIVLPAFFLYMLVIFPSGTFFCFKDACGINFWGVQGHDAIWHLAIANVSFQKFPFIAPTFAGENLYGYNYLLDFFIFLLSKIGIPAIFSYFKLFPVVWFILFTGLLIIFARKIKDSKLFIFLFLLLSYFAGSFSFILTWIHDKTINGSSTLLPQPIMHMMSNLPYAFSLLPFLTILILMKEKNLRLKNVLIMGLCIFLIMGLKFYGGVISIFLIFTYLFLTIPLKNIKKLIKYSVIICLFIFSSILLFYDPMRSFKSGAVFGWAPFALVHTITEEPNQFYLRDLTDARYYILAQGRIGPRFIWIEFINLTLFLIFYLGTRILAFFYLGFLFLQRKMEKFDLTIILTILFSIFLTVTLVQKAEWWNTIQFFFYAIFLLTIHLARLVHDLIKSNKPVLIGLTALLLLLSVPTSLDLIRLFAVTPGATYLPVDEIKALNFLKQQPGGIVLSPLYDKKWKNYNKPNLLFAYEDTAYVTAFSGKQSYLVNILQLRLTGVLYQKRLARLEKKDCSILDEIDYVYEIRKLLDEEKIMVKCRPKNSKKIFENKSVNIYSITK
ncbi:hypothetical protein A3D76_02390 [Candidatus Roizmanbacteria bacterium RIFCSPHIGHO2_02_FULL_37_9b]|nr:MAG: hypothetical protein A3D76_02390 [Candidatus Roizmanbacteria bacterium RIFCSPHIGHO2_02_FULL_37_9b]